MASPEKKISVVFLLYSEEDSVPGLVSSILRQKSPSGRPPAEWMEVIFVDNGSRDRTREVIRSELTKAGNPSHIRILGIDRNEGIARGLNRAFSEVKTPYVLTVHCDVLFGSEDYVAEMLEVIHAQSDAAAVAGQPSIPKKERIPFAEKLNLVANLQDIFPAESGSSPESRKLVRCGFVEGRCDAFRTEALRAVGFYDTTLRFAGEDQVMAARLRSAGYELYQAPWLRYSLSVSNDQNDVRKLIKHQRLFGRAHPYITLMNRRAISGLVGDQAGANRALRTLLRVSQLATTAVLAWVLVGLIFGAPGWSIATPLILVMGLKYALFRRHAQAVGFSGKEWTQFYLLQLPLDVSYTAGLFQGMSALVRLWISGKTIE